MYEVIGDRQLLDVGQSVYEYYSKIASFQQLDLSAVPYELQSLLVPMLSTAPSARPSAISITGSQYFQVFSTSVYVSCFAHNLSMCNCDDVNIPFCTAFSHLYHRLSVTPGTQQSFVHV